MRELGGGYAICEPDNDEFVLTATNASLPAAGRRRNTSRMYTHVSGEKEKDEEGRWQVRARRREKGHFALPVYVYIHIYMYKCSRPVYCCCALDDRDGRARRKSRRGVYIYTRRYSWLYRQEDGEKRRLRRGPRRRRTDVERAVRRKPGEYNVRDAGKVNEG